jgi:hypothetical protein
MDTRDALVELRARFPVVGATDAEALPSLWAAVVLRMLDEGLIRGHGSIPGELAEGLIARFYRGALAPPSNPDFDVLTPRGRRIQVKALRYSNPRRSSVGAFNRRIAFDELAIVRFEYDMSIRDALLVDARLLRVNTATSPGLLTPAGMRLSIGRRLLESSEVVRPEELRRAGAGDARDAAI